MEILEIFHCRGSGSRGNEADKVGGLNSHALASFIQSLRLFILSVKKCPINKVLKSPGHILSQGQAARGKNMFFHRGL